MSQLSRVTTQYVETEDRLRLTGSAAAGEVQTVWLTQRLLLRLLPVLLQWLEGHGADTLQAEVMQSFAQQAAQAELTPQAPVRADAGAPAWLAMTVDVTRTQQAVGLTFRGADGEQTTVKMVPKELRQWLAIVHDAYGKAQWVPDVWPIWVSERTLPAKPPTALLH